MTLLLFKHGSQHLQSEPLNSSCHFAPFPLLDIGIHKYTIKPFAQDTVMLFHGCIQCHLLPESPIVPVSPRRSPTESPACLGAPRASVPCY